MEDQSYYSKEDLDRVKAANDIVDVISEFTEVQHDGNDVIGRCPFDKQQKFTLLISKEKQLYQCVECGASGDIFSFVMDAKQIPFEEAAEFLAARANIRLTLQAEKSSEKDQSKTILAINRDAARFYFKNLMNPMDTRGLDYFHTRGLSDETIKRFGLGYATPRSDDLYQYLQAKGYNKEQIANSGLISFYDGHGFDKFRGRAMCPVIDTERHVLGFSGRCIEDNGQPKYKNSPSTLVFDKRSVLFGLQRAQATSRNEFIICEGNLDVISLHQAGFDNAVAPLGTAFTKEQAEIISQYTNHVHLVFDSDDAGRKAALRAIPILQSVGLQSDVVHLDPHKDPDEFVRKEGADKFEQRLKGAEPSISFEIHSLYGKYNLHDSEQKQKMLTEFAHTLLEKPASLQDQYIDAMNEYIAQYNGIIEIHGAESQQAAEQNADVPQDQDPAPSTAEDPNEEVNPITKVDTSWLTEPDWYSEL